MCRLNLYLNSCSLFCSSGLHRDAVQRLMESDDVDIWRIAAGGSVEFRVSAEQFQRMKGDLPECEEAGNVEELVREMEQRAPNRTVRQEWFEEYVRKLV